MARRAHSRETTAALMSHRRVGLLLATGGQAMVHAAYRSGTPAIGVGPGNAPALISADADLRHVARSVVVSKSFDNGLICGAENHLVVEAGARARADRRIDAARRGRSDERRERAVSRRSRRSRDRAVHVANRRPGCRNARQVGAHRAALHHPAAGRSDRLSGRRELPRRREAGARHEPVHGRQHG